MGLPDVTKPTIKTCLAGHDNLCRQWWDSESKEQLDCFEETDIALSMGNIIDKIQNLIDKLDE